MKKYKLLCILPVYNSEKYLNESISSILHQSFEDFRLLIINDGSTDGSIKIIESFDDTRINIISNVENKGLIYSLNLALQQCNEDYIVRMDSDDIANSDRFEKLVNAIECDESLWVVGSQVTYFGNQEGASQLPIENDDIVSHLFFRNPLAHPTVILRVSYLKKYNLVYELPFLHVEDYRLWTRIVLLGGRIKNLNDALLKYRIEGQNISLKNSNTSIDNTILIWQDYFAHYGFTINKKELFLHGILAGISKVNSNNIIPFFIYLKKFEGWLLKLDDSFQSKLMAEYEMRMNKLFFNISNENLGLIIDFWIFRKKIRKVELIYFLGSVLKKK